MEKNSKIQKSSTLLEIEKNSFLMQNFKQRKLKIYYTPVKKELSNNALKI